MITCKVGENIINCYDGTHNKEQLKKWASKNILICHVCNKSYEYCHGEFVSPYFRHKEKNQCEDRYSEPESQEHINGKRDLYEWIKIQEGVIDAVLEGWLPETKQRPDIMFKYNGKQYVIEYQCTPIASEYVERHELYKASGIEDIWILGTREYFNNINQNESKNRRGRKIEESAYCYYDSINKIMLFGDKLINVPIMHMLNFKYYLDAVDYINQGNICTVSDYVRLNAIKLTDLKFNNDIRCSDTFKLSQENIFKSLAEELNQNIIGIINCVKSKNKRNKIYYNFDMINLIFKFTLCGMSFKVKYEAISEKYEIDLDTCGGRKIVADKLSTLEDLLNFIINSSKAYNRFKKISKYTQYDLNYSRRTIYYNYDGTFRFSYNYNIYFYKRNKSPIHLYVCIFIDNEMRCRIENDEKIYNYKTDNDICVNILTFVKCYAKKLFAGGNINE